MVSDEALLRAAFARAVAVADPVEIVAAHLPQKPKGRVLVLGAGKASARMAEAVEAVWGPCEGLVITRYGYARPCRGIEIVEAGHPVPDAAGEAATARMIALIQELSADDFVLMLISGGASSLLVAPVAGVSLAQKSAFNAALLASGAPISVMNALRKRLSRVKGGQLAGMSAAPMLCLMISDVPGDDMALIGSGPTVGAQPAPPPPLDRWGVRAPQAVLAALKAPAPMLLRGDPRLARVENRIIAAPIASLKAAAEIGAAAGFEVRILGDALEGEARVEAARQAEIAREIQRGLGANSAPVLLLSGGELTVTRRGNGIGGPNAEFCLALALKLEGAAGISALACDTDGVDGAAEVAGAVIDAGSLARARALNLSPQDALRTNDAHRFFKALNAQVITGPTLTNVNDFRAIAIRP